MRSRYTAYSRADIDYIQRTMRGKPLMGFNAKQAKLWASNVTWVGLQVLKTGLHNEHHGYVEFMATFIEQGQLHSMYEISEFECDQGIWFYSDGRQKH
jgi:SEC-C motif domain protein